MPTLIPLKIVTNTAGFLLSYMSYEPKFILGILIGVGMLLLSILIPEKVS